MVRETFKLAGVVREGFAEEAILKMTEIERKVIPVGRCSITKDAETRMLQQCGVPSGWARGVAGGGGWVMGG